MKRKIYIENKIKGLYFSAKFNLIFMYGSGLPFLDAVMS